ncbi:MAG: type II toxin-antitoxin system Phd/YefM family antitoxin [Solirubrobacteraceae bacterium]
MRSVTVQEAKTQLSALLRAVEAGEQVEIRRGSTPIAMLVQRSPERTFRDLAGAWADVPDADPAVWEPDPQDAVDFGLADG